MKKSNWLKNQLFYYFIWLCFLIVISIPFFLGIWLNGDEGGFYTAGIAVGVFLTIFVKKLNKK